MIGDVEFAINFNTFGIDFCGFSRFGRARWLAFVDRIVTAVGSTCGFIQYKLLALNFCFKFSFKFRIKFGNAFWFASNYKII